MTDFYKWRYGPNGEAEIFTDPDAVPDGWQDHPFPEAELAAIQPAAATEKTVQHEVAPSTPPAPRKRRGRAKKA